MISPERLRAMMEKTRDAVDARDKALASLQDRASGDNETVEHAVEYITGTFHTQLSQSAENAAKMATQVRAAGQGAEASHKKVKAMDARLNSVRSALSVVQAVVKQRSSVSKVSDAVRARDFEGAVDCIVQYDSVSRILVNFPSDRLGGPKPNGANKSADDGDANSDDGSTHSGSTGGGGAQQTNTTFSFGDDSSVASSSASPDETVTRARAQLHEALLSELDAACKAHLEPSVCRFATMLAKLGFADDGCDRFTAFVVGSVKADLDSFVSSALSEVQSGKTTHLVTCVSVLDRIASAMERHKSYMDTTFPGRSDSLILALHSEATQNGVDVLRDFLSTRRGVVGEHSNNNGGKRTAAKPKGGRDGSAVPARAGATVDPRSLDQTLEDISHLLTCCHQYLNYVAECVTAPLDPKKDQDRIQAVRAKIQNSPLLKEVSGLMNIYVPVQGEYLHAAFQVMITQCDEHLAAQLEPLRGALDHASTGGGFSESILTSFWGGGAGSTPAASPTTGTGSVAPEFMPGTRRFEALVSSLDVTLVEDLFHVLLIAIRRAAGTRDITIASATVNSVNAVLLEELLPELKRRLTVDMETEKSDNVVSASVRKSLRLKWLRVAHNAVEYTSKLAIDCEHVAAANFSGKDMFRLSEQKHDFTQSAATIREALNAKAKDTADAMVSTVLACARPTFENSAHVLQTEAAYVNAGLADTWVTVAKPVLEEETALLAFPFPEALRDTIVASMCSSMTGWLEQTIPHKPFDAFGALQLDRELRDLRNLFADKTETPIRDHFRKVLAMSAVLMADSAADAVAEGKGHLDDPARLFEQRVDLLGGARHH